MAEEEDAGEVANVVVAVRCRPLSKKELGESQTSIATFPAGGEQVVLEDAKGEPHSYQFDHVFSPDSPQDSVFQAIGIPLLEKAFAGFNGTIFAYGQTGSGKTHTMMNHRGELNEKGLIPRINQGLFVRIAEEIAKSETRRFLVCCSFLEIYNEIIFDLLAPRGKETKGGGLEIREQKGLGIYVKDLTEVVVEGAEKLNQMIEQGFEHRSTAATKMNDVSSRSHCIFIIRLHQKDASDESNNTFSKINLVDLAGSERAKSTEAEGARLKEGANINKSLSALGNVINALSTQGSSNKKVFVPYRNSKLTRVLQESLGGNSLCTMVAAMSPASANSEETLSTLNYARRAKSIKLSATKNEESSNIKKLEDEVSALKAKLEQQALMAGHASMSSKDKEELESKYVNQIEELQSFMKQSWQDKQNLSEKVQQEQERALEQAAKAQEKLRQEKKRRLKYLEDKAELGFTLGALKDLETTLNITWPDMVSDAIKAEQNMRSQLHAVKAFRDSAGADLSAWWSRRGSDGSVSLTLLGQVNTKLGSMRKELDLLAKLEVQMEEKMGAIAPKVGLSLHEAQSLAAANAEGDQDNELEEILSLVQRQLAQHHAKARSGMKEERSKLGFGEELGWLTDSLEGDSASPSNSRQSLRLALQAEAAAAQQSAGVDAEPVGEDEALAMLGLANCEWPDDRISASSNAQACRCARLLQQVAFGGWCPQADSRGEYLQLNLGVERRVAALSMQGRQPSTSDWSQTRDLLQIVFPGEDVTLPSGDKLPSADKFFKRPPVRLVHDIGIALSRDKVCFDGWEPPVEYHVYGEMSREQKVAFFDEIITRSRQTLEDLSLSVTAQDILSGKNCDETNKLLQLLAYSSLRTGSGLDNANPQWTTSFKLEVFTEAGGWRWCGAPEGADADQASIFEGNSDATTVKYVCLPSDILASQLRLHPAEWHVHAALRCEVHVASKSSVVLGSARGKSATLTRKSLEDTVTLICQGVAEVQKSIQNAQSVKVAEEESKKAELCAGKDKAEQERDDLEKRLQDALDRIKTLDEQQVELNERASTAETSLLQAETSLLQTTVERDRLSSENAQLGEDLATRTQGKTSAEETMAQLREESDELKSSVEDLGGQLEVMTEERDLARTKEEELFEEKLRFEEEIMDTNNGYVWVTERLQEKEEEMENLEEQVRKLQDGCDGMSERCSQLQDELMQLRVDHQAVQGKLGEEVRMHKAAQDRYVRVLKDRTMESSTTSRPETASTSPSAQEQSVAKTPEQPVLATANTEDAYEDDFDDDGEGED